MFLIKKYTRLEIFCTHSVQDLLVQKMSSGSAAHVYMQLNLKLCTSMLGTASKRLD